ncbi:MAG: PAS domain-containing protein [Anaerolineae bacterium]|nr:PAS domain-containing protein [Anaerolineae bacterium]
MNTYLLFHTLSEGFSIAVACALFVLTWNTWKLARNSYLQFLGIAFLFVGVLDLAHTLAYKGMGIFVAYDANLPTQLWIAARFVQAASLLVAPVFVNRRVNRYALFGLYTAITSVLIALAFARIFPVCYLEGEGLTPFKVASEYAISALLGVTILHLLRQRDDFDADVFRWMITAIALTIASELVFTFYIGVYDIFNFAGHVLKIAAFYFIYRAIVETGLRKPYAVLFRDIQQRNDQLQREIVERAQAEQALRESEERFRQLAETIREVFWIGSPDWDRILYVSPAYADVWGQPLQDLYDRPMSWMEHVHAADREELERALEEKIGGDFSRAAFPEFRIVQPDGTLRWILARVYPIHDAAGAVYRVAGIAEDITTRKQAEQAREREVTVLEHLSGAQKVGVTGAVPLRQSAPALFDELVERYGELLDEALAQQVYRIEAGVTPALQAVAEQLGRSQAGPRDVIDIYIAALRRKGVGVPTPKAHAYAAEGRLMALELMGYLVSFYRTRAPVAA